MPNKQPYPDLHEQLVGVGFTHRNTRGGHHQYKPPPDGRNLKIILWGSSPSDHRARRNAESFVKRALQEIKCLSE